MMTMAGAAPLDPGYHHLVAGIVDHTAETTLRKHAREHPGQDHQHQQDGHGGQEGLDVDVQPFAAFFAFASCAIFPDTACTAACYQPYGPLNVLWRKRFILDVAHQHLYGAGGLIGDVLAQRG